MSSEVIEVRDSSFEVEVIQAEKAVLVDFWASWCGPCKAIAPVIDELSEKFSGKMKFVKCNVDDNPITPGKYDIKAIPTLIFFKGGSLVERFTGVVTKSKLEDAIDKVLSD